MGKQQHDQVFQVFFKIYYETTHERKQFKQALDPVLQKYGFNLYHNKDIQYIMQRLAGKMLANIIPQEIDDNKPAEFVEVS
ncbi:MAG: hypothetical protein H6765_06305 [Candidatus Peribacteria bacterium]|nr:MAG: hypothetical protein H6765_06305 [Candidatus Peribacteria bacterium]